MAQSLTFEHSRRTGPGPR